MRKHIAFAAGLAALLFSATAYAENEEIVVTGSRIVDYESASVPNVVLVKRADFLITRVRVVCDTRDPGARINELKTTLRNMIRAAHSNGKISLAVTKDDIVSPFDETMIERAIQPDNKVETSVAYVIVKTPVTKDDTFDGAADRIEKFVKATPISGRTEILREARWDLTIVGPEQYRAALLKLIVDDAKQTATAFGPEYGSSVEGLQHPVEWYQSGPLDLSLFIRYALHTAPH